MQDVRYAIRLLKRSPGFAITATLTLALSIGANAAIWSAVKGILIAPLPYPDPNRLVRLFEEAPRSPKWPMAPADFRDYRNELQTFESIAAYVRADLQLGDQSQPEQLRGMRVTRRLLHPARPPAEARPGLRGAGRAPGQRRQGDPEPRPLDAAVRRRSERRRQDASRLSGKPLRDRRRPADQGFQHVGGSFRTLRPRRARRRLVAAGGPEGREAPAGAYSHFFNVVGEYEERSDRGADGSRT